MYCELSPAQGEHGHNRNSVTASTLNARASSRCFKASVTAVGFVGMCVCL